MLFKHEILSLKLSYKFKIWAVWPVLFAVCLIMAVGCARFAPAPRTVSDAHVPESFTLYDTSTPAPDQWWVAFGSAELDGLIQEALSDNLTLRKVAARVAQAEALAMQAGATRWPELDASGDMSATRRRVTHDLDVSPLDAANQQMGALNTLLGSALGSAAGTPTGGVRTPQAGVQAAQTLLDSGPDSRVTTVRHSYGFGLSSRYEVDLWGRVRAREQAALLDLEATREDMYAAMLSLTGLVARQWLEIGARLQELELVREQLALNNKSLELIELRFRNGLATALDVFQQRQMIAQTESLIPMLEASLEAAHYELAVLLGRAPQEKVMVTASGLPDPGPLPAPGVPADLLARRPDIRAAGLQLEAADWRVSVARADRLPSLRLTASASYGAESWSALLDNWMATLAGSVTGPVFDAGRRRAEVERARAAVNERLAAYREQVLESLKEVETAMMRESKQAEYAQSLARERDTARATYEQARERYLSGVIDYLPVLTALTQLQAAERRLLQAEHARLEQRIHLYIVLGGGWMEQQLYDAED